MKNLIHLTETRHFHEVHHSNDFIQCLVSDPYSSPDDGDENAPSHYILSPSGNISAISSSSGKSIWTLNLCRIILEGEEDNTWFDLYYDENSDKLVALSHSGAIVSIDPRNAVSCEDGSNVELIGQFDHGISCSAWSADGEVLALVTYSYVDKEDEHEEKSEELVKVPTLMTMNTNFEILAEEHLSPVSNKENESMIHICWNQKHDNALIAVSSHDVDDNKRKVRIFKGESLELMSISRTEDGSGKLISNLIGCVDGNIMAWAGGNTSNLLACVQRKGKKGRNIIFLEPNGLQHGSFKLDQRLDCEEVVRLNWNAESDLLAVTFLGTKQKEKDDGNSNVKTTCYGKIQLYHRSNYHWYLKNEIQYEDGMLISSLQFDKVQVYDLSVGLHNCNDLMSQEWRHYTFTWDTSTTVPRSGMASVIDGCHLNLTMFQRAIVPPPMYSARLSFDSSIVAVTHNSSEVNEVDFVVHLSNNVLVFCGTKNESKSNRIQTPEILSQFDLTSALSSASWNASCLRQMLIIDVLEDNNSICVKLGAVACSKASSSSCDRTDSFVHFNIKISLEDGSSVSAEMVESDLIELDGKVLRMVNWSNSSDDTKSYDPGALIELTDASLFEVSIPSSGSVEVSPCQSEAMFLEPCPWIAGLLNASNGRPVIFGLSARYRLYCGDRQLCDASSSFCLSPTTGFLSYVTLGSSSQLRFLPIDILSNFDPFMGSDDNLVILGEGYEPRNVERGSRLVSILPDKITAVLQLPRGNLEAVYPRALVLPRIMSFIKEGEYHFALDMMRRQKVDMNLIVDMYPNKFLESKEGVQKLLRKVQKIDHLNLFIASLSNFDFTSWKYPVPTWFSHDKNEGVDSNDEIESTQFDFSLKVNKVCEKMRIEMMNIESSDLSLNGNFLLPILSTFAKQQPPKLEDALSLIKKNSMNVSKSSGIKYILLSDKAQSSIQYLAFLADYELIFDTALGMYDFDLAKAVARNSQMDPKVYLPMLKKLNALPEFEAKYQVDMRLNRYESALINLHKLGASAIISDDDTTIDKDHFKKCKIFIEKYNLHKLGLELFINHPQWHGEIMISLGENLLKERKADLALTIFLAAKPKYYDGAKRASRVCGDWKTFFTCMLEDPNSSTQQVQDIATSVADEVSAGRGGLYGRRMRKDAAARILIDYCDDIAGAIDLLISAEMWFEARRLAVLHGQQSTMTKEIVDAAVAYSETCLSNFEEHDEKFAEASKRYSEVVFIRREAKRDGEDGKLDDEHIETGSLFSLASNASNSSVRSNMSSSSVGSVSSLSSVISAGASSSFSVLNDDATRHKSKFNSIGKKKKKKRKTRRERMRLKPGSEEELQHLISKMKENIIDDEHSKTITETITFLTQVGMIDYAKALYEAYEIFKCQISEHQQKRIKEMKEKTLEKEKLARREGEFFEKVVLDCEEGVDQLCCSGLSETIHSLFLFKIE